MSKAEDITGYIVEGRRKKIGSLNSSPADIFLMEIVEICDSISHCRRLFTRKKDGEFTQDSFESFQRIATSSFALIMSHFETYQKQQFAHLIDCRYCLKNEDDATLAASLEDVGCDLNTHKALTSEFEDGNIGAFVANSLPGWHKGSKVNGYFKVLLPKVNVFSNSDIDVLNTMWQIRHSIVHTGGRISRYDATKVPKLREFENRDLTFREDFIDAVGREFHRIAYDITDRMRSVLIDIWQATDVGVELGEADDLIGCTSPRKSWLPVRKKSPD